MANWSPLLGLAGTLTLDKKNQNQTFNYGDWLMQRLMPGYSAYTPEQLQEFYNQAAQQLRSDVFKQWEEGLGRSLANRNLTGSGVGRLATGKILGEETGALANLWGDIWRYGQEATRQDIANAAQLYQNWWAAQKQLEQQEAERRAKQRQGIFSALTSLLLAPVTGGTSLLGWGLEKLFNKGGGGGG